MKDTNETRDRETHRGRGVPKQPFQRAEIRYIDLPADRRVIVISDVHGDLECLQGLLKKIHFSQDDVLLLLGDMVEKGPKNLETLQYIIQLCKQYTVYPMLGNCDKLLTGSVSSHWLFSFRDRWGGRLLLNEFARLLHFILRSPEDVDALREQVKRYFPEEWNFLNGLPTILISQEYLFVHGGIPGEESLEHPEDLDELSCTKNDAFLDQGYEFHSKWCVVGHWPVTLYRTDLPNCSPLVDTRKQIVCIDGGRVVKQDGQLNALFLPPHPDGQFSWLAYDGFPRALAMDAQAPSQTWGNIRYGDNKIDILQWGEEFCTCRHRSSGTVMDLPTVNILQNHHGFFYGEDFTDYKLPIQPGDAVSVVAQTSRGYLVKKDGAGGWYTGRLKQPEDC